SSRRRGLLRGRKRKDSAVWLSHFLAAQLATADLCLGAVAIAGSLDSANARWSINHRAGAGFHSSPSYKRHWLCRADYFLVIWRRSLGDRRPGLPGSRAV